MLKSAEKNYSTPEKELLAVHDGLMHFRPYIPGTRITIKTDHRPLLGILTTKKSLFGPRWGRRLFQLSEFDFAVRSEEHKSELQSLMRSSYALICLQTNKDKDHTC